MGVTLGLVAAGVCGGCGGGADGGTTGGATGTTAAAVPLARVVAAGDAICAKGNQQIGRLPTPAFDPAHATGAQLRSAAPYLHRVSTIVAGEVDGAAAAGQPAEKATELRAAIKDAHALVAAMEWQADAAAQGDVAAFQRAEAELDANPAGRELAALGFTVCGQG